MLTLNQITGYLLEKYGVVVTPGMFTAFRMHIRRMIAESPELQIAYENAPGEPKLFGDEFRRSIEGKTRKYLLNIKGNMGLNYKSIDKERYPLSPKMNETSKINMFIEYLFNEKYNFDEETYAKDVIAFNKFLQSEEDFTTENLHLLAKIKNPGKYYVSKKTKRK